MVVRGEASKINFKMVDETDYTPLSGLTVTTVISVDGGSFAATTNSAVEISDGWYYVELTATETDYDEVILKATATGAAQSDGVLTPQSAATSSTTISGGGGAYTAMSYANCSWMDKDIKAVTEFFNKYKEHMDAINADREPMAAVDTKLSEYINEYTVKHKQLEDTVTEIADSLSKIERLLLKTATTDQLEAYYDGIN